MVFPICALADIIFIYYFIDTSGIFTNTIHALSGITVRDDNLVEVMLRNEWIDLWAYQGEINSTHDSDIRATSDLSHGAIAMSETPLIVMPLRIPTSIFWRRCRGRVMPNENIHIGIMISPFASRNVLRTHLSLLKQAYPCFVYFLFILCRIMYELEESSRKLHW